MSKQKLQNMVNHHHSTGCFRYDYDHDGCNDSDEIFNHYSTIAWNRVNDYPKIEFSLTNNFNEEY